MWKTTLTVAACATLLWAGTALATPTPQQKCDYARITAWKKYQSCIEGVVAKEAKIGPFADVSAASAKCRHTYFKKWAALQGAAYKGSTCIGSRFTDNLSGLTWEKKQTYNKDDYFTWSTGAPYKENGTAFNFVAELNSGASAGGFAGAYGWRLPTLAELQSIVLDFGCKGAYGGSHCTCPSSPCVEPALDASTTQSYGYWSATSYVPAPFNAWLVFFYTGEVFYNDKTSYYPVRAVRGGL
jgi:hypothetical protein